MTSSVHLCEDLLLFIHKVVYDSSLVVPPAAAFEKFVAGTGSWLQKVVGQVTPSGSPTDPVPAGLLKEVFSSVGPSVLAVNAAVFRYGP